MTFKRAAIAPNNDEDALGPSHLHGKGSNQ
jgi:hypothetical protein